MSDDEADQQPADSGFGLDELDRLAQRAVDAFMRLVRRGTALGGGVLMLAVVFGLGGFLLGLAALDDGIETVWIFLGGSFCAIAIASAITAIVRLQSVRKHADDLVGEVRSLISGDRRTKRTVIETVESTEAGQDDGVVAVSQHFFSLKTEVGDRVDQFQSLGLALAAVTRFPGLVAIATIITFVFAGLSVLFLIALAL